MKYLFPSLMAVAILSGLLLLITPFIMPILFPVPTQSIQHAQPEDATVALKHWFNAPDDAIRHAQGMRERLADVGVNSYFTFEVEADVMRQFIHTKRLQQLELTDEVMKNLFVNEHVEWWQPQSLQRETYFSGEDKGILLHLLYNAERKRGFLLLQQ